MNLGTFDFLVPFQIILVIIQHTWWIWAPFLLFYISREQWRIYLRSRYFSQLTWKTLEVRLPRLLPKTPEAMEHVFAGLMTMRFSLDPLEVWWEGLQNDYLSFELVSFGGDTRFFIRCPEFYKNVVEAHVYSQYPEAEIAEQDDYMSRWPDAVPSEEWDMFGIEFKLSKDDAYPIRTYSDLKSLEPGSEEEERVDPLSAILEGMGKLEQGQFAAYHILMRPAEEKANTMTMSGAGIVSKITGVEQTPKKSALASSMTAVGDVVGEISKVIAGGEEEEKKEKKFESRMLHLSPGEKDVLEKIQRKMSKPAWQLDIRYCIVAPRAGFGGKALPHLSAFIGGLRQFNTIDANRIVLNSAAMATNTDWWKPAFLYPLFHGETKADFKARKKRLFYRYFQIRKPFNDTYILRSKHIILSVEELATIYHYPGITAKAPNVPRIEAKRAEPPTQLPVG